MMFVLIVLKALDLCFQAVCRSSLQIGVISVISAWYVGDLPLVESTVLPDLVTLFCSWLICR